MKTTISHSLRERVAVVAGGTGSLGQALAAGLAAYGARVAITGRSREKTGDVAEDIARQGGLAKAFTMDVLDEGSIEACCGEVMDVYGRVDILVNAVGGNSAGATTSPDQGFFDLAAEELQGMMALNFLGGTVLPCKLFGKRMVENPKGASIINISSMAASRPLTRVVGYGAAKAAVDNFTRWLAVHMAREYSPKVRVNAIAPGFFLTDQNRFLLLDKAGELTDRGRQILAHTPMGEFGQPEDLVGTAVWLASDASRFVTGTVVAVDGGFSAYAGV